MSERQYKYDVAFSFLDKDKALAIQLNDLLSIRFKTFIYTEKQEIIAGTDGEKTFNAIFGDEARLVVVLYRTEWGRTSFTRIEETAIRNRAFNHGYDFTLFLRFDDSSVLPEWLPKCQIWLGYKEFGINGAASVIEYRIQQLGGQVHEESIQELTARLDHNKTFQIKRKQFLDSADGVEASSKELHILLSEIERLINQEVNPSSTTPLSFKRQMNGDGALISGLRNNLNISWHIRAANSLDESQLIVVLWNRLNRNEDPNVLNEIIFDFDLLQTEEVCWQLRDRNIKTFTTSALAEFILRQYMTKSHI